MIFIRSVAFAGYIWKFLNRQKSTLTIDSLLHQTEEYTTSGRGVLNSQKLISYGAWFCLFKEIKCIWTENNAQKNPLISFFLIEWMV